MKNTHGKLSRKALVGLGIGAVVGAAAFAGVATAGNWGDHDGHRAKHAYMMDMFERVDANSDGKISQDEISATRSAMFGGADADNNTNLTVTEFETLWLETMRPMMTAKFQKLDHNADGMVTEAEFAKPIDRMASWLDRNDDGVIELKEIKKKRWYHDDDDDEDDDDD